MSETYSVYTLVDITNATPQNGDSVAINQAKNRNSLLQTISMRSLYDIDSEIIHDDDKLLPKSVKGIAKFKKGQKKNYRVWQLTFSVDRTAVFGIDGELLISDLHMVPVISNLTGTYKEKNSAFYTKNGSFNTLIVKHED